MWQKKIGCVAQETFVADDKLKNNIAIGEEDKNISEKQIKKSLKLTNLEEFSQSLKFGINTVLGQQGSRISGGQKQRIGIARAIYNNPEILILDEATSSLDSLNEKIIVKNLFDHFQNQTIIFVSHNLENLKFYNVVYEIENKKLKKNFPMKEGILVFNLKAAFYIINNYQNIIRNKNYLIITDKITIYNLFKEHKKR